MCVNQADLARLRAESERISMSPPRQLAQLTLTPQEIESLQEQAAERGMDFDEFMTSIASRRAITRGAWL